MQTDNRTTEEWETQQAQPTMSRGLLAMIARPDESQLLRLYT
jgi:hypothetical protein